MSVYRIRVRPRGHYSPLALDELRPARNLLLRWAGCWLWYELDTGNDAVDLRKDAEQRARRAADAEALQTTPTVFFTTD